MAEVGDRQVIDVYFAEFADKVYAFGLTEASARITAEASWAFGDPKDDYCVGNHWAASDSEAGWRIVRRTQMAFPVETQVLGAQGETCHVAWRCPVCNTDYSEDVELELEHAVAPPLLSGCSRTEHHADAAEVWVVLNW